MRCDAGGEAGPGAEGWRLKNWLERQRTLLAIYGNEPLVGCQSLAVVLLLMMMLHISRQYLLRKQLIIPDAA